MTDELKWEHTLSSALEIAKKEKKHVLVDFYGPKWGACQRMETGTFLQEKVIQYVGQNFIPLKYESGRDAEQFMRFNVRGTPTFLVLDADGNETRRLLGYYSPDEFIEQLETAGG